MIFAAGLIDFSAAALSGQFEIMLAFEFTGRDHHPVSDGVGQGLRPAAGHNGFKPAHIFSVVDEIYRHGIRVGN